MYVLAIEFLQLKSNFPVHVCGSGIPYDLTGLRSIVTLLSRSRWALHFFAISNWVENGKMSSKGFTDLEKKLTK